MIGHKAPAYISELQSDSHYQTSIVFYPMEQLLIRRCTDVQYFSRRVFDSGLDVEYKIEPFLVSDNQQLDTYYTRNSIYSHVYNEYTIQTDYR